MPTNPFLAWPAGLALASLPVAVVGQTPPAFPGAEGFGAGASGGRGGQVLYVTNLNANGPGSLQEALDTPGPRYVLFKVSGLIDSDVQLTYDDVTIAGQTSPGGIIVRGFHTTEEPYCDQDPVCMATARSAENWILRHIRSRPGVGGFDDGLRFLHTRRAIVDHLSIANATDEAVQISFSNDLTIQKCIIAETLGPHAQFGGMLFNYSQPSIGFELDRFSVHHNVWNRILGRMPELTRESQEAANTVMDVELSNNLLWDPGYFIDVKRETFPDGPLPSDAIYYRMNWVGNYSYARATFPYGMISFPDPFAPVQTTTYWSDNRLNLYPALQDYELNYCCNDFPPNPLPTVPPWAIGAPHPFPPVSYQPSTTLQPYAFANLGAFPRDPMDRRLMDPVDTGVIDPTPVDTNPYNDAFLFDFPPGSPPPPPTDTDADGMPDAWELLYGLNPNLQDHNGTQLSIPITGVPGYTNLECYINQLADALVTGSGPSVSFAVGASAAGESSSAAAPAVVLSAPAGALSADVTVAYASADATATAGSDYSAVSGTLTFPAGSANGATQPVVIPLLGDALDELDESFIVDLSDASGGVLGAEASHTVTILDDDPSPVVSATGAAVLEGDAGATSAAFAVALGAPSGLLVTVSYASSDGSAVAGSDYTAVAGSLSFAPGTTSQGVTVSVNGDLAPEPDERFYLALAGASNAILGPAGMGTILDDDGGAFSIVELHHGSNLPANLQAAPGPLAAPDLYVLAEPAHSSHEVLVDAASGDIGATGPLLERLAADLQTVLQSSLPVGAGSSRSLRHEHAGAAPGESYVRVSSAGCGDDCGPEDVYRIRAWDTRYRISRFNNSSTQTTVLVVHNTSKDVVSGNAWFWSAAGAPLGGQPNTLGPNAALALNTSTVPGVSGQGGAVTVSHDGRYGCLAGKAVAVEPATGFTFDSPMEPVAR